MIIRRIAWNITLRRLEHLLHSVNFIPEIFNSEFGFQSPIPWGQAGFTNHILHLLITLYPRYNIDQSQVHETMRHQYRSLTIRTTALFGNIQLALINAEEAILSQDQ